MCGQDAARCAARCSRQEGLGTLAGKRKTAVVLTQIAENVLVHQSEWCQSNAVIVRGSSGVLLVDPGVHGYELAALAGELIENGDEVTVGFSTHPHWDHLLWHARLGSATRYGTARCAATVTARLEVGRDMATQTAHDVSLDLFGAIVGLAPGTEYIPWDGPRVRIVEHQAHAAGHAALLIEDERVLVAGDMLSDVLMPMLDLRGAGNPVQDYLDALRWFDDLAAEADLVVPGHGSVGSGDEIRRRIDQDRAYVRALGEGRDPVDARVGPAATFGRDWLPDVHARQVSDLAANLAANE
jgi:glyoxylase-like metal-dependent hydrolase (beta-lactamase superfamily II)